MSNRYQPTDTLKDIIRKALDSYLSQQGKGILSYTEHYDLECAIKEIKDILKIKMN